MTATPAPYTWAEFKSAVEELLPVEKKRKEVHPDSAAFFNRVLRAGVREVVAAVPYYQRDLEVIYYPKDFAVEGKASVGALPPDVVNLRFQRILLNDDGETTNRYDAVEVNWEDRHILTYGADLAGGSPFVAVDPHGIKFYITPTVDSPCVVSLFCDGRLLDYQEDAQVPFDEDMVSVVADYVAGRHQLTVNNNTTEWRSFNGQFMRGLGLLRARKKNISKPEATPRYTGGGGATSSSTSTSATTETGNVYSWLLNLTVGQTEGAAQVWCPFQPKVTDLSVLLPEGGGDAINAYVTGEPTNKRVDFLLSSPVPAAGYKLQIQMSK